MFNSTLRITTSKVLPMITILKMILTQRLEAHVTPQRKSQSSMLISRASANITMCWKYIPIYKVLSYWAFWNLVTWMQQGLYGINGYSCVHTCRYRTAKKGWVTLGIENVCILGDRNIDFLQCDEHGPKLTFLDILYTYNIFPDILKPTRITKNTAALIDHIPTNKLNVSTNHKPGIIFDNISGHNSMFHISE